MIARHRWVGLLAFVGLLALPASASAQLDPVGHVSFRSTGMYEGQALLVGAGIGLGLGEQTRLELVGHGPVSPDTYSTLEFNVAYGGVRIERELVRSGPMSASLALQGGLGWFWVKDQVTDEDERTGIMVAEPELVVGLDLGTNVQIAATASSRWVSGVEGDILNRSDGDAEGFGFGLRLALRAN
jgi:hypothetical protein